MGNTCKPMAVSFQCMTKFTTNKKIKKLKKKTAPRFTHFFRSSFLYESLVNLSFVAGVPVENLEDISPSLQ